MTDTSKLLSTELVALVHHVELSRSGWWEKTLEHLVLASIWLADLDPTVDDISDTLNSEFGLSVDRGKIDSTIIKLDKKGYIVFLPDSTIRITESKQKNFEEEIETAENVEKEAKARFSKLVRELCDDLDPQDTWVKFESTFLAPFVQEIGANTYKLFTGGPVALNQRLIDDLCGKFDDGYREVISKLVTRYLDSSDEAVRSYLGRMLHATLCVSASGLPETVINKLNENVKKNIKFRIFVDTNFLFSLLELHDNPSNYAAIELKRLIDALGSNPKVELYITPRTIYEAKRTIKSTRDSLAGPPLSPSLNAVVPQAGFSGLTAKYISASSRGHTRISAEDWFGPYLNNFAAIAQDKGIKLYNEKLEEYATRQDVVNDIHYVLEIEEERDLHVTKSNKKSYDAVEHDMILWHLVEDNRPSYIESPIEAIDWILTLDFRLISFDEGKRRKNKHKFPICLHPTSLIQMLQFWVPRTNKFEEAVLGSAKLPFLFHDFDSAMQEISLRILRIIAMFEDNNQFSESVIINVMLNKGLRSRIEDTRNDEEEIQLIRDALLEELRSEVDSYKGRATDVSQKIQSISENLDNLKEISSEKDETIKDLEEKLSVERDKAREAACKAESKEAELLSIKLRLEAQSEKQRRYKYMRLYSAFFSLLTALSIFVGYYSSLYIGSLSPIFGSYVLFVVMPLAFFVLGHLVLEFFAPKNHEIRDTWLFVQVIKFKRWLWSFVFIVFVSTLGSIMANWFERGIGFAGNEDTKDIIDER